MHIWPNPFPHWQTRKRFIKFSSDPESPKTIPWLPRWLQAIQFPNLAVPNSHVLSFLGTQDPEAPIHYRTWTFRGWGLGCSMRLWCTASLGTTLSQEVNLNFVARLLQPSSKIWLSSISPALLPSALPHLRKPCFRISELFLLFLAFRYLCILSPLCGNSLYFNWVIPTSLLRLSSGVTP